METLNKLDAGLLAALPTATCIFDGSARLIGFNEAYRALFDLDAHFLAARPSWSDLVARLHAVRRLPEVADLPNWRDQERHRLASLTRAIEERQYLPDGRTLKRTAAPLPGGGFLLAFEDLTPRLAAERAVNQASLVQRQTLDHLGDALAVFGPDGKLKLANGAFTRLWEWQGERLADFIAASGSDWSVSHLLGRAPGSARLIRDGRVLDAHHLPLPDGAVLLRYVDVTVAAQLADAINARAETAAAADRMKSEFVATLAHEARAPLTTIAGFAEMLAGGYAGELTRRQNDYAQGIASGAHQLAHMIDDILDLASIDAGMVALDARPFDLHAALAGLVLAVGERARAARLTLVFDCPPAIGKIDGDERRIRQAVLHLLNNAISYSGAGGTVTLAVKRTRTHVEISIDDTGVGIARSDLDRIQEPFVRGKGADARGPGAGLGLTLVRRFVELHGGELRLAAQLNRGTTATILLPFCVEESVAGR